MRTNDEIITIIENKMKEKGFSMSELARRVGMAKSALSRYFNRTREFPLNRINEFAQVLDLEPSYILGFDEPNEYDIVPIYSQLQPPRQRKVYNFAEHQLDEQNNNVQEETEIYLYGQTAAGAPISYGDTSYETISANVPKGADGALLVRGDSMEPLIEDNSIIFYKKQPVVETGEIAIIELNGSEVTCKKFYFDGEKAILRSMNDKYEDIVVDGDIRIVGKVII